MYLQRLEKLETVANSFPGVEKSYALQAGREIRVVVKPEVVSDEAAQELADALQEGVEIEDGGELDGDLVEDLEGLRLAGDAGVETGVLNGLGNARGSEGEHVKVLGAEEVGLFAFNVHDADEAVLGDEWDGQLGTHVGIGIDIVLLGGGVVEEDGLARERDLADNTLADRDARVLDLGRVADLKSHAQLVRAVVEQEDGKDTVGDEGANQLGGAGEQGLQVECGVERVGETHQIGDVGGLDARVDGVESGRRGRGVGGAVIALELVWRRRWRSVRHWRSRNDNAGNSF